MRGLLVAVCAAVAVAGCSREAAPAGCPPAPLRATPGPEAIDALLERHMRDSMAGRAVPGPAARQAARRAIAMDCVHAHADSAPGATPRDAAVAAVTQACGAVIARYIQSEVTDATLRGDEPPGPGQMAALRAEFSAAAAGRLAQRQGGPCPKP
ncbi:hypothetical protein [Phenylobacterium sp.]|jgi:hypothetical protein|uniref:hypothetical protein n=1 Tax=Phenylobacterium sp. TaxID=1871053 RepID=UPI002F9276AF